MTSACNAIIHIYIHVSSSLWSTIYAYLLVTTIHFRTFNHRGIGKTARREVCVIRSSMCEKMMPCINRPKAGGCCGPIFRFGRLKWMVISNLGHVLWIFSFRTFLFEFPHFGNFLFKTGTPMRNVFESHLFSEDVQNSERPYWRFLPGGPLPVVNGVIILVNGLIKG